jgi:hypothetical protein
MIFVAPLVTAAFGIRVHQAAPAVAMTRLAEERVRRREFVRLPAGAVACRSRRAQQAMPVIGFDSGSPEAPAHR